MLKINIDEMTRIIPSLINEKDYNSIVITGFGSVIDECVRKMQEYFEENNLEWCMVNLSQTVLNETMTGKQVVVLEHLEEMTGEEMEDNFFEIYNFAVQNDIKILITASELRPNEMQGRNYSRIRRGIHIELTKKDNSN